MSRVDSIAKNVRISAACQVLLMVVNFALRRVFVLVLGREYLGLDGLFTDILSMLSLAELGFGTSVLFSLYKPVAEGNQEKIKSLMSLYRRAYQVIGTVVLVAGVSLTPFLNAFVKEMPAGIPHIRWIYILNVLNSGVSYFFIYKTSLLFAYEKKYVELLVQTAVRGAAGIVQALLLVVTGNYFLYLGVAILTTVVQNVTISMRVDRMYPYLREKDVLPLLREDKRLIRRNLTSTMLHKFGEVAIFGTDSLLLAKFVSVGAVGTYSNYMLIRKALVRCIDMVFSSITPSMGNLTASEPLAHKRMAFDRVNFFAAWLFGWMCICLFWLYNPFIALWLGEDYLFPMEIVALIVVNFYVYCMRIPVCTTKDAMGLFWIDRYKPLVEAAINLAASILLARRIGIAGVLLGTLISTVAAPLWVEPLVLSRYGLERPVRIYFKSYFLYLAVTVGAGAATGGVCALMPGGIGGLLLRMAVCTVLPNLLYMGIYRRTEEFHYLSDMAVRFARRAWDRIR